MTVLKEVNELSRFPSPAPKPQALAFDGKRLWLGSIETNCIYAMDPQHWTVQEEAQAPGKPWGMTALGDELRVICGETAEDNRIIRTFIPGHGFKLSQAFACPDDTGSHLSYDGKHLFVSQWYNKRLIELGSHGEAGRVIAAPQGICGQVFADGAFYLITTEDEERGDYHLTRIDPVTGSAERLARVPFHARALAHDGVRFWTNHRASNQTVSFVF